MAWRQGLAYGQDLRDRVLAARDAGQLVRAVAERFSVSPSYVAKADRRRRRTGERRVRRSSGHPPAKIVAHLPALTERVGAQPHWRELKAGRGSTRSDSWRRCSMHRSPRPDSTSFGQPFSPAFRVS
jgi:hypothetical protein